MVRGRAVRSFLADRDAQRADPKRPDLAWLALPSTRGYLTMIKSRPAVAPDRAPSIDPELLIRMLLAGYCLASARNGGCAKYWSG